MKYGVILIIYAVVCFIGAAFFEFTYSPKTIGSFDAGASGITDPLVIKKDDTVVDIEFEQAGIPLNIWSYVEVDVLDHEQEYLFSLSNEFWHETGYDDEGKWVEWKDKANQKVTFPWAGTYYLEVSSNNNSKARNYNFELPVVYLTIYQQNGSGLLLIWLGIAAGLVGGGLIYYASKQDSSSYHDPSAPILMTRTSATRRAALFSPFNALLLLMLISLLFSVRIGAKGWGYMGYQGFHNGPSWWYFSDTSVSYNPNVRERSVNGSQFRGRGASGGK